MFFDDWSGIGRVLIATLVAYMALIFLLQLSGKRTLAKMTAFDFVVTIAVGSVLANIALSKSTPFMEGITALMVLIGAQYFISSMCVKSKKIEYLVKPKPTLLLYQGQFLQEAMRRERVTEADVLLALRQWGHSSVKDVEAVILEADGSFNTVVSETIPESESALRNVHNYRPEDHEVISQY
ncbi:DUF421 domain-containing protein [Nitrosococcus watsonii]|uniref:DUF421 domain-containing protein n=1 Tax=Nitrosococcus watsoni (strain C-113) TaxID=105559 RepID=D8K6B2_NITWC|nr:YetF domain-containing protein [Nitrosococcus watsonii]ADJ28439.1 protein of unknown function DUF421 [Nitrosococcus watsonii C-113]